MNIETFKPNDPQPVHIRKANEFVLTRKRFVPPTMLFDEFWREGETALLFGASGTGKSLLAVQLGEALARGRPLVGFRMPSGRRRVLYVDLEMSDRQFQATYTGSGTSLKPRPYKFAENFFRGRPSAEDDLCSWLRGAVAEHRVRVVIIDALSAIKRTHDGTRETLILLRRLKEMREELNISLLVITDSRECGANGSVGERDLGRSRVLCRVPDSVFGIGRNRKFKGDRYVVQTRARGCEIFWDEKRAPVADIVTLERGLLGFRFDDRFRPEMDEATRALICRVHEMRIDGRSYRAIAAEIEISTSRAVRLADRWIPAMEIVDEPDDDDDGDEFDDWDDELDEDNGGRYNIQGLNEWHGTKTTSNAANAPADGDVIEPELDDTEDPDQEPDDTEKPQRICDLELGFNGYGRDIYIQSRCEHTQKPTVWYERAGKGFNRHTRVGEAVMVDRMPDDRVATTQA